MTQTVKNIIPRKLAENVATIQYLTPSLGKCRIDKFTVTNSTGAAQTLSVNLVPVSGSASSSNIVLSARSIAAGETYACPEVVGQLLESLGFISTLASSATALTISATGTEIT
jgi:hypothetical protein